MRIIITILCLAVLSGLGALARPGLPDPAPAPVRPASAADRSFHDLYVDHFAAIADAFGPSRLVDLRIHPPAAGNPNLAARATDSFRPGHDLVGLELISLLHGSPVAFVDPLAGRSDREVAGMPVSLHRELPTRALDPFEQQALAALRAGRRVVASADGRRLIGAVRARSRCTECHAVDTGELMGAFSYTFAPRGAAARL